MLAVSLATFIQFAVFIVAFIGIAFFAGSEIAFLSADKLAIKNLVRHGRKDAQLTDSLVSDMQHLIGVVLVGTNLAIALSTVLATSLTLQLGLFGQNGVAVTSMLMTVMILVFGEILPKTYCSRYANKVSLAVARPIAFFARIFGPIARVFSVISRKLVGAAFEGEVSSAYTEESIMTMVTMGEEAGSVAEEEREMIYGVFESSKTLAREIMVPRIDMVAADIEDGVDSLLDMIVESGYSRIPVYEDTIDNIIGIVYAKDVLNSLSAGLNIQVRDLLRPVFFIPETKKASELLQEMRAKRVHMAIVIDEYGGTAGLVTIEDILEEIVGEIHDEYDDDEEAQIFIRKNGDIIVDARLSIEEANEVLGLSLPDEEVETIGGFVYECLGRIPSEGEIFHYEEGNLQLQVVRLEGRRISRVKIKRLQ